ncbi:hypothetical protein M413DRAFT_135888 [Hebeloma cylindrosporum]|uniref:Uncharacterized protein n=1 Tax=Hebeloma cylindrosporum TaxID=76867 RepID=A0A0C3CBR2_HEBCY|nr:hypothetical protein M413DRAFT_135888 [Hebeloma cylindrosporum h7]
MRERSRLQSQYHQGWKAHFSPERAAFIERSSQKPSRVASGQAWLKPSRQEGAPSTGIAGPSVVKYIGR